MAKNHPTKVSAQPHDYLPAAGRDAFLPFYDRFTALLGAGELHRTLIAQAGLADGQRVLEIGCGTGNLTLRAKRAHPGVDVVGSDPDPLALAAAERKARRLAGVRFERGYAQRLPYPDAGFDRVLSALMLHHLDDEAKTEAAAEVRRVLRPGGSLHVVDFHGRPLGGGHGLHGRLAGRLMTSGHFTDHAHHTGEAGGEQDERNVRDERDAGSGDGILRLLDAAGLDSVLVDTRRHRFLGQVSYYRAVRPA
ncbi:class I SAM-dependent methyltransferase [Streptacidiphilus anmyonensis]|uniref:class I SAM-dependent methyltransferase n=1 Tax=Streptacidiphilus anmyonensis TaxID=405782 RepID=UPI0005AB40BD|nr:methyltransferase domain-containing protein [Streptacidiphilus anmyonensis]